MSRRAKQIYLLFHFFALLNCLSVLKSTLKLSEWGRELTGARLLPPDDNASAAVDLESVTVCVRFNVKKLGTYEHAARIMNIEDPQRISDNRDAEMQFLYFGAHYPVTFFGFGYPRKSGSYASFLLKDPDTDEVEIWATFRWHHFCLAYDKKLSTLRVILDGKPTNINSVMPGLKDVQIPPDILTKTYLGRCSFDFKKTCSAPEAEFADFNVWDRGLSVMEMVRWTSCQEMLKGNIVDWDTAKFDLVNMEVLEYDESDVCVPAKPGDVILPELRNFTSHTAMCRLFRGRPTVVQSLEHQMALKQEFLKHPSCGNPNDPAEGRFWAGWWDEPEEGVFQDVNSGEAAGAYQPWYLGEPNGDTLENCVMVWLNRDSWNDMGCETPMCSFCNLDRAPDIQIRGLCFESHFDNKYSWSNNMINGRHSFRGYTDTLLFWDSDVQLWKLESYSDDSIYATLNVTEYPLGSYVWQFHGEPCLEEAEVGSVGAVEVVLNINTCNSSEFNCRNGFCVTIEERCDGKSDCPDKSDEIECKIFTTDVSYLKEVPPTASTLTSSSSTLAQIGVSMDILNILDIVEVDNIISLQFQLRLTWKDSRLTMLNLKEDENLNTLTTEFRQRIWIPEVVFHNTQDKEQSLNDDRAFATIRRNGSYVKSEKMSLENAYIFSGKENPLTISRVYKSDFLCDFNMAVFPFDTQRCSVILTTKGNSNKFIELFTAALNYLGPIDLTQYFVKSTSMETHLLVSSNEPAIKVDIVFGRRILAPILTTYLPTILLCIVSFSTNYFKAFFFEAIVTVNLTALLVQTTLFISVSDSLPKTSYIKMIDIWLIFNLFIPFTEVLLHTYIDSLRQDIDRKVNHHGSEVNADSESTTDVDFVSNVKRLSTVSGDVKVVTNGKFIRVNPQLVRDQGLVARDEEKEVEAKKSFYTESIISSETRMKIATTIAGKGLPIVFLTFVIAYFALGLVYYTRDIE